MADTSAQALVDAAKCYECSGDIGMFQLFKLGLLQKILLASNPMADTSPQALIDAAKCYACQPPGLWQLFELGLLQQISTNGAGGSGSITSGAGAPVAAPASSPALYIDENTGIIYSYYGGAWH